MVRKMSTGDHFETLIKEEARLFTRLDENTFIQNVMYMNIIVHDEDKYWSLVLVKFLEVLIASKSSRL